MAFVLGWPKICQFIEMANKIVCHSCTFFGSTGLEEWPYFEPCMFHFFNFCKKIQKNENRLCPLPYEEVLEDIINPYTAA